MFLEKTRENMWTTSKDVDLNDSTEINKETKRNEEHEFSRHWSRSNHLCTDWTVLSVSEFEYILVVIASLSSQREFKRQINVC